MMTLINRLFISSSVITVLLVGFLASSAGAETATFQRSSEVAEQLADFKRTAWELRREADALNSVTPSKRLSWQSHTYRLDALKDHVNEMGKTLAALEAQKSAATEGQRMAIEYVRPHLVSVAQNVTQAIELVNEDRKNVHWGEYAEAVSNIYDHADALHGKLDTILDHEDARMDYENARMRFETLELPTSAGGS
jgi:hypothetical protein